MSPERPRSPVVVLISGRGTNMRALIEYSRRSDSPYTVAAVLSDRGDAAGLRIAAELGVPAQALVEDPGTARAAYDRCLAAAVSRSSPSLVALAGFMRILSDAFVREFEGHILNIHPSLLPQYPGLHTHRRVLAAGDAVHGATVHYVTAELDSGPAVIQARIAVGPDDDESSLARRVQAQEHRMYPLAVRWHCEGRLRYVAGAAWFDGAPLHAPLQLADIDAA
ncbi:MAG: phosphoribosylglycinamide formyltransferase [Steroidobacterales bacterium]